MLLLLQLKKANKHQQNYNSRSTCSVWAVWFHCNGKKYPKTTTFHAFDKTIDTSYHKQVETMDEAIRADPDNQIGFTSLVTADGEEIRYKVCNRTEGMVATGVGALFVGLISTGLGEMNGYLLLQRCRVPSKVAVATSVFVVAITALTAASGHFARFIQFGGDSLNTVLSITLFTVPGVIIGGQLGSWVASRIPQRTLETGLGMLFLLVALLTLGEVLL